MKRISHRSVLSMSAWLLGSTLAFGSLLVAAPANAEATFPKEIKDHLGLECEPTCLVCHSSLAGGTNSIDGKLANTVWKYFLANKTQDVVTALTAIDAVCQGLAVGPPECPDTDLDGVSDIEDLRQSLNPRTGVFRETPDGGVPLPEAGAPDAAAPDAAAPDAGTPDAAAPVVDSGVPLVNTDPPKDSMCSSIRYGCGARVAPAPTSPLSWEGGLAGIAVLLLGIAAAIRSGKVRS
jgi:hypothetical protein